MALLMRYPKPKFGAKIKVSADAEEFICDALLDQTQPVSERFRALSIRRISGSECRNALIEAMWDGSSLLAYYAAYALGLMQEPEAIPAFLNVLYDRSLHPIVRHKAAEALGAFGLEGYVTILAVMSRDPAQEVRETCEVALTRIAKLENPSSELASFSIAKLREVLLDEGNTIYDRLEALFAIRKLVSSEGAVSAIIESLAAKSPILRHGVACALSQLKENKKAVDALSNVLQDPCEHPLVRQEAAKALGSIAGDHCVMLLKEFANDPEPIVSQTCEVTLKRLDFKRLGKSYELVLYPEHREGSLEIQVSAKEEKLLCHLLLDEREPIWMRCRALSLYNLGGPGPRNALVEAMWDTSALLAYKAALSLGLMRDFESIPALQAVLSDLSLHLIVRHKAAEALGAFGLESNVPALKRSLASDPAPEVRETCEVVLGRIADVKKLSPLLAPRAHWHEPALPHNSRSIPILREILLDENKSLYERVSVLFRLGTFSVCGKDIRDKAAAALIESLDVTSTLLRYWTARVLSAMRNEKAVNALKKLLEDPREHPMVRLEAAERLAYFKDCDCKLLLERIAARDSEPIVTQSCEVACVQLDCNETIKPFGLVGKTYIQKWRPTALNSWMSSQGATLGGEEKRRKMGFAASR